MMDIWYLDEVLFHEILPNLEEKSSNFNCGKDKYSVHLKTEQVRFSNDPQVSCQQTIRFLSENRTKCSILDA